MEQSKKSVTPLNPYPVVVFFWRFFPLCRSNNASCSFFSASLFSWSLAFWETFSLWQSVCPFKAAILYPSRRDSIPLKKDLVLLWKKQMQFWRTPRYSSSQLLHATNTYKYSISWRNDGVPFCKHVHFNGSILNCVMWWVEATFLQSCMMSWNTLV